MPVDCTIRRKSALNSSNGIDNGSKNSKNTAYAFASYGIMPKLLAASPSNVLTRAALTMLPSFVFSDLQKCFQYHFHFLFLIPTKNKNWKKKIKWKLAESWIPESKSAGDEESSPRAPVIIGRNDGVTQLWPNHHHRSIPMTLFVYNGRWKTWVVCDMKWRWTFRVVAGRGWWWHVDKRDW